MNRPPSRSLREHRTTVTHSETSHGTPSPRPRRPSRLDFLCDIYGFVLSFPFVPHHEFEVQLWVLTLRLAQSGTSAGAVQILRNTRTLRPNLELRRRLACFDWKARAQSWAKSFKAGQLENNRWAVMWLPDACTEKDLDCWKLSIGGCSFPFPPAFLIELWWCRTSASGLYLRLGVGPRFISRPGQAELWEANLIFYFVLFLFSKLMVCWLQTGDERFEMSRVSPDETPMIRETITAQTSAEKNGGWDAQPLLHEADITIHKSDSHSSAMYATNQPAIRHTISQEKMEDFARHLALGNGHKIVDEREIARLKFVASRLAKRAEEARRSRSFLLNFVWCW